MKMQRMAGSDAQVRFDMLFLVVKISQCCIKSTILLSKL